LARRGISFHLIDRLAEPVGWSQAIFIKSRTLEILACLGLRAAFYEHGQIVDGVDLYANADRVADYRFKDLDTPFPHILSLPESEAIRILTEKLESLGGSVERSTEFVGLEQNGETARARLRSAKDGEYDVDASWIVGTDGYHSAVREAIGDAFDGRDYPELWGVFDTFLDGWQHPRDIVCAQLEVPIAIPFPLGEDRWRIYFRTPDEKPEPLEQVAERLAVVCPNVRLKDPEDATYFHSHSRLARSFRTGRVFLAGDAAHASNPIEGHGMNAGIQDAFNLGWKLAAMVKGQATAALVESYEAERRPADADIVRSGDEAYARMTPEGHGDLEKVFEFLSTQEGRDFAAMGESELGFCYTQSPIVEEVGALPDQPTPIGCRVGEVEGLALDGKTTSLHEILSGTAMVVFMFAEGDDQEAIGSLPAFETAIRDCPAEIGLYVVMREEADIGEPAAAMLLDPEGRLRQRLAGDAPAVCVIRPDGHLAFRCLPPSADALRAHLARLFLKSDI